MSATETPHPSAPEPTPAPPPERHCRRCGATLGPDQEWCLACGAAAQTDIARPRAWRLPLVLAAVVVVLAIAAAVLAIAELSKGPDRVAQSTPTPTISPAPTVTPTPGGAENEGDQPPSGAAPPTASPGATVTPVPTPSVTPGATTTPAPGATVTPTPSPGSTTGASSFPDWPAGRTAWTVILESATSKAHAESVARDLQSRGDTVGILHSDDHSSLRSGYWVVFSGQYDSRSAAQSALSTLPASRPGAYARKVSAT